MGADRTSNAADRPTAGQNGLAGWIVAIMVTAGYLGAAAFFAWVDPYHNAYFSTRYVFVYNILRLVMTGYVAFCVYATGAFVLRALFRPAASSIPAFSFVLIAFFAGVGIWHLFILAVGHASLLNRTVILIATTPIIFLAGRNLLRGETAAFEAIGHQWRTSNLFERAYASAAVLVLMGTVFAIILSKGIYPGGGHDYWLHYFHFFDRALEAESTLPNEAWYQYFYSKGMGVTFLAMVLTDPMGGQLAGMIFLFAGAAVVAVISLRLGAPAGFALGAAALLLLFYTHTPGIGHIANGGGWGQLQKNHITSSAIFVAIVWMTGELLNAAPHQRRIWMAGVVASIVAVSLATAQSMLLVGLFAFLLLVGCLALRRYALAIYVFFIGGACAASLAGVLVLNYAVTGVPLDQMIVEFWPIVQLQKLIPLGGLQIAVGIHQGISGMKRAAPPLFSPETFDVIYNSFFLYLATPLFLKGALFALGAMAFVMSLRKSAWDKTPLLLTVIVFLVSALIATVIGGTTQPISFPRYAEFNLFLLIILSVGIWQYVSFRLSGVHPAGKYLAIAVSAVVFANAGANFTYHHLYQLRPIMRNGTAFLLGKMSIYDGFKHQEGLRGVFSWSGVYPGVLRAWEFLGPRKRFWSFHLQAYCMLPGCWIESRDSFPLGEHFRDVYYGTAEAARAGLQADGLNHFFVVTNFPMGSALPYTELFNPDNIGKYLGYEWTDGRSYLLTWLDQPGVRPLPPEFIEGYRNNTNGTGVVQEQFRRAQFERYSPEFEYGYQWPLNW